MIFPVFCCCC